MIIFVQIIRFFVRTFFFEICASAGEVVFSGDGNAKFRWGFARLRLGFIGGGGGGGGGAEAEAGSTGSCVGRR